MQMMAPPPPRYIGIQIAAAVIFACTVMNLSLFLNSIEELWASKKYPMGPKRNGQRAGRLPITTTTAMAAVHQKVCVLVPGGGEDDSDGLFWNITLSSLAGSITSTGTSTAGEILTPDFSFGVYVSVSGNSSLNESYAQQRWIRANLLSSLHFVRANSQSLSVYQTLISASTLDGCSFLFVVDQNTGFTSPDWASFLVHALQSLSPQYLGVASLRGCKNCIFVHSDTHQMIFSRLRYPPDRCWSEWVRLVYGSCRVVSVDARGVVVRGDGDDNYNHCATKNQSAQFSALVSHGRLHISKVLSLGLEGFRAARMMLTTRAARVE